MKLSSTQPGNLWIEGQPETFSTPIPDGVVSIRAKVTDYWGQTVYDQPVQVAGRVAIVSLTIAQPGWYSLSVTAGAVTATCTFGVVLPADTTAGFREEKVCADAAAAWGLDASKYEQFADIVKAIGLPMVRERIWWSEMEPSRGVFTWGRYETLINAYAARGIAVDEIWHDTPAWARARPGNGISLPPNLDDLRGFCLEASKHYRGKVAAWEVWNEPDNKGIFFDGSAKEFDGVLTTAYKALKEGSNNEATVLQGAMCLPDVSPFARDLFALGAGKYTDAFNWHSYEAPSNYLEILNRYRRACNLGADAPTWMTEAGIFLGKSPDGDLSADDARKQCDFVPRSIAQSLASGVNKHFFFILRYLDENGACLGALRKDLTPNPSIIALSAAAHLLGQSNYLKSVEISGVTDDKRRTSAFAVYFSNPSGGKTIVVWANEKCDARIRIDAADANADIKLADIFGQPDSVDFDADGVTVRLGLEPKYILIPPAKSN